MSTLLRARGVTFHRNGERVFAPRDVDLAPGGVLLLRGPNGSGKTTLLRLMAGILRPAEGTLERTAPVVFLGHLPAVKGDLSCRENLRYERRAGMGTPGVEINRALARVGLAGLALRPARSLSAGQLRRLGLARLLVRIWPLWLLDEPYASLDDAGAQLVDDLLDEHLTGGGGVALATHQSRPALAAPVVELALEAA